MTGFLTAPLRPTRITARSLVLTAAGIGVGSRLLLATALDGNWDQQSYEIVAGILRRGGNLYLETYRYNYSPAWGYWLVVLSWLADLVQLHLHFVVRAFLTLLDLLDALLIGLIAAQVGRRRWEAGFALFLLNPVAVLLTGAHGQFENLAMLPLLLATYLCHRKPNARPRRWIWLLGSIALIIKQITVFSVWMLFAYAFPSKRRALLLFLASVLAFLATFIPYLPAARNEIWWNVLSYRSAVEGTYGLGLLLPPELNLPLFGGLMMVLPFVAVSRLRLSLVRGMELAGVALLALIPGIGAQYFMIPVIFGSVFASRSYLVYSGAVALFLLAAPTGVNASPSAMAWNVVWLAASGWLLTFFAETRAGKRKLEKE